MKARVKTAQQIKSELQKEEILRLNKLWLFSLNQSLDLERDDLLKVYKEVCEQSNDAYEKPELWFYIDELLIDKFDMGNIFTKEDISERESTAKQIHKDNKEKWRRY